MLKKAQTKYSNKACLNDIQSSQKPILKSQSQSNTSKFNKFDIVWAKITGYPWWPAIVTTVPGEKDNSHKEENVRNKHTQLKVCYNSKADYRVDFIADQTHAFLKKNFLLKYIQNRERLYTQGLQFSSRKRRFFQMAINEADQLQQVLQISKVEVNQSHLEEKKDQQNQKYSKIIPEKENDDESLPILSQQIVQFSKIKNEKVQAKFKKLDVNSLQRKKLEHNLPIQITKQNQKNSSSLQKDIEKKQDNKMQVTQVTQKRRNKSAKITSSQSNSLFINESRKNSNIVNNNEIEQVVKCAHQQNSPQVQIQIYEEKENFNEMTQQKQTKNKEKECEKKQQLSIKVDQIFMLFQNSNVLMNDLLIKYKLDTIDEVQDLFKKQIIAKNRVEISFSVQNTNSMTFKGGKSGILKSIISNLNKKRNINGKRFNGDKYYSESNIFAQNITIINKLKDSEHEKISSQQRQNIFQYAKKYTSRKIYLIVLNILKKNKIQLNSSQIQSIIKEKCKNISNLIFLDDEIQKVTIQSKINSCNNKKRINKLQSGNFFTSFKRMLEQSVKFLRLFTLQNWQLLTKVATFSTELCIEIKSFQQYLQKQCHLIMRNEQKFEEIVKQIGIQCEKTAFIYGPPINQMQVEYDSINISPTKYLNIQNECHSNLINQGKHVIELK